MGLELTRVQLREASKFVGEEHRHHPPTRGHVISVGASVDGKLVGVAVLGRPNAKAFDYHIIAEVTRVATNGYRNACSFLYGAIRRVAFDVGFKTVITYTLVSEPGTSLKAAGFRQVYRIKGRSWDTPTRRREDDHTIEDRWLWAAGALLGMEL